ncbi:uncharacterized protein [Spinacia oleracea]|uniref:Aspartic peptidase DDI1-type domain-containing protein n=1 Tax=Spinacia oleracea TaxID=3562 RepID=A0ABM3QVR7_SPIOL|nr:uncharacterized protein LOC130462690 [Spinacia oleracea]
MIETQLAQLASTIKEQQVHISLPPQGQPPKKLYAIVTRSGKTLDDSATHVEAPSSRGESSMGNESSDRDDAEEKSRVDDMSDGDKSKETPLPPLPTPFPPYPHRHKWDVQFAKFLVILRQLYVTIPFTDSLKQMPSYTRFLKEILSGKRDLDVKETVNLTENSIYAFCDLGASISILPYSVFAKLDVGDLVPTNITLQLADRSVKYPIGKVEDVPLVVGELTFLVDFVVLDIDEDAHTPIILGRPFLATAGALIDVQEGLITLKAGDAKASFKRCANELARSSLDDKNVHGVPKALGDELEDVVTIPEIFEMHVDDDNGAKPSKVFHGSAKKVKKSAKSPPSPEEGHVGGLFGFRLLNGDVGKIFVPKGTKKCMLTSVDPRLVVFDPP